MNNEMKIYTQKDLYENEINTDAYEVNLAEGTFTGILALKAWTSKARSSSHGRAIRAFVDLYDGRKIIALVQPFRSEQIATISAAKIGSVLTLKFETSSSGMVFLSELTVCEVE
ncbi:MAG: hypothetical protein K6A37_00985 [Saccharofermentans sp.]|nr:hypothetical protein [Saccharofermentans sp.]